MLVVLGNNIKSVDADGCLQIHDPCSKTQHARTGERWGRRRGKGVLFQSKVAVQLPRHAWSAVSLSQCHVILVPATFLPTPRPCPTGYREVSELCSPCRRWWFLRSSFSSQLVFVWIRASFRRTMRAHDRDFVFSFLLDRACNNNNNNNYNIL